MKKNKRSTVKNCSRHQDHEHNITSIGKILYSLSQCTRMLHRKMLDFTAHLLSIVSISKPALPDRGSIPLD